LNCTSYPSYYLSLKHKQAVYMFTFHCGKPGPSGYICDHIGLSKWAVRIRRKGPTASTWEVEYSSRSCTNRSRSCVSSVLKSRLHDPTSAVAQSDDKQTQCQSVQVATCHCRRPYWNVSNTSWLMASHKIVSSSAAFSRSSYLIRLW
jgi:hypothetical protein